ncbi:MAG: cytochrome P450 [Proteobacteria bacterium]|nr:MAG: cytochrome P450 [Pseudomonadota bacterium]
MDVRHVPVGQLDVISAKLYGEHGYPHDAWRRLRAESPVTKLAPPGYEPFWAITKHADIIEVSKQPHRFRSAGRFILFPRMTEGAGPDLAEAPPLRMLVNMDPPEHRDYRRLVSAWFTPRAVHKLEARLEEITRDLFDELAGDGGWRELDFVPEVAALQPLRMITEMLGIPREREQWVLKITNQNFGLEDPDFALAGETREQRLAFLTEAAAYINALMGERRKHPTGDVTSVLAHATLDGQPVPAFELFSLYFLIMVAGHDTTRNAISGGLLAFLQHPEQFAKLQKDPSLVGLAADEIVRWTTPVNHFSRTATEDTLLRGQRIAKGDSVALFYASANRDEDVYADPYAFRIERDPNPHLGFGVGEHFCLGAHLARMDLRVFWRQFAARCVALEPAGPHEFLHASFVGGPKRLPIRVKLRPKS